MIIMLCNRGGPGAEMAREVEAATGLRIAIGDDFARAHRFDREASERMAAAEWPKQFVAFARREGR